MTDPDVRRHILRVFAMIVLTCSSKTRARYAGY